jgi:hypothetical protein
MHCVTPVTHQMQKHKFGVTCSIALFKESAPGPPEHEKQCINVSWPRRSGIYYVTRRSHRMQKYMFGVTCPNVLFLESVVAVS